jgi:hypothetical protein
MSFFRKPVFTLAFAGAGFYRRHAFAGMARGAWCLALCLAAGGCGSIGQALGPFAQARERGVTIAFESIDGVAGDSQAALLRDVNEEASAFHIAVAPDGGEAAYRIRGYVASHAERRSAAAGTSVAWAWDVYDAGLHRAVRLSGEERAAPGKGGANMDEALLRRIARAGMEQLADFMALNPASPAAPLPARNGSEVASREDAPAKDLWTQIAAWGR